VTTLYGIKNCDTVKKARQWLKDNDIDYQFHDFREQGVDRETVVSWISQLGWETVVNKRSTSWKQLDETTRQSMDEKTAIDCILGNPTLVKRPLLDRDGNFSAGFKAADYQTFF
jgi:arsenate reductase